jgi:hypothetical protein
MANKMRTEAHDNSFIAKLYRPADKYIKNLVKQVSDVPKEYLKDSAVNDRAKFSHGSDQASAKAAIAAREGRPNQVKEAIGAIVGKTPKKGKK